MYKSLSTRARRRPHKCQRSFTFNGYSFSPHIRQNNRSLCEQPPHPYVYTGLSRATQRSSPYIQQHSSSVLPLYFRNARAPFTTVTGAIGDGLPFNSDNTTRKPRSGCRHAFRHPPGKFAPGTPRDHVTLNHSEGA